MKRTLLTFALAAVAAFAQLPEPGAGGAGGGGGGGDTTSVANSGASGAAVLKTGTNVTARKIIAGTNVTVTENTDDVTIASTGGGVAPSAGTVSGTPPNVVLTLASNTPNQIFTVTLASNITPTLASCSTGTPFTVRWVHDATATVYIVTAGAGWSGLTQPYQAANGTSQQSFVCDGSNVAQGFNDFSSSYSGAPQLVSAATGNPVRFVDVDQTVPNTQSGTTVPGSCTPPAAFVDTDATAGSNYLVCVGSSFVVQGSASSGCTMSSTSYLLPYGWPVQTTNLHQGDGVTQVAQARWTPMCSGSATKLTMYIGATTGSGKGFGIQIRSAAGSQIVSAALSNPTATAYNQFTLSGTFNYVAGTDYFIATMVESGSTEPSIGATGYSSTGLVSPLGTANTGTCSNNTGSGSGASFTFSTTCGTFTGSTYYPTPWFMLGN